jgi:hypothetical protein
MLGAGGFHIEMVAKRAHKKASTATYAALQDAIPSAFHSYK